MLLTTHATQQIIIYEYHGKRERKVRYITVLIKLQIHYNLVSHIQ